MEQNNSVLKASFNIIEAFAYSKFGFKVRKKYI